MGFTKATWANGRAGGTSLGATNLNLLEDRIEDAVDEEIAARAAGDAALDTRVDALESATVAVESVNGETGAVVLDATDVGAAATVHTHAQGDITGLTAALAAKQDASSAATQTELDAEAATRAAADTALDGRLDTLEAVDYATQAELDAEASARAAADTALDTALDSKADLVGGVIPSAQIPAVALTRVFTAASEAAQLALTTQEGDVVVRTDETLSYMRNAGTSGTMTDFTLLDSPSAAVLSVNGETGTVVLSAADVGAASSSHTHAQADVTDLTTDLAGKQPLDSDLTAIAGLSPSNDDIVQRKAGAWTNRTVAQFKTDLSLVKGDVGLGNVDNTSDANKPVSTATQTALDLKAALASPALTGNPTAPTQTARDGSTKLATTAYVDAADQALTANEQTANYTLVLTDAGKVIEVNNASARTVTVPPNSSVAFPVGTVIEVLRYGAGTATLVAGSGVTIRSRGSLLAVGNQYGAVSLRKRATDEWVLVGDLA